MGCCDSKLARCLGIRPNQVSPEPNLPSSSRKSDNSRRKSSLKRNRVDFLPPEGALYKRGSIAPTTTKPIAFGNTNGKSKKDQTRCNASTSPLEPFDFGPLKAVHSDESCANLVLVSDNEGQGSTNYDNIKQELYARIFNDDHFMDSDLCNEMPLESEVTHLPGMIEIPEEDQEAEEPRTIHAEELVNGPHYAQMANEAENVPITETEATVNEPDNVPAAQEADTVPTAEAEATVNEPDNAPVAQEAETVPNAEAEATVNEADNAPVAQEADTVPTAEAEATVNEPDNVPVAQEADTVPSAEAEATVNEPDNAPIAQEADTVPTAEAEATLSEPDNVPAAQDADTVPTAEAEATVNEPDNVPAAQEADTVPSAETEATVNEPDNAPVAQEAGDVQSALAEATVNALVIAIAAHETGTTLTADAEAYGNEQDNVPTAQEAEAVLIAEKEAPIDGAPPANSTEKISQVHSTATASYDKTKMEQTDIAGNVSRTDQEALSYPRHETKTSNQPATRAECDFVTIGENDNIRLYSVEDFAAGLEASNQDEVNIAVDVDGNIIQDNIKSTNEETMTAKCDGAEIDGIVAVWNNSAPETVILGTSDIANATAQGNIEETLKESTKDPTIDEQVDIHLKSSRTLMTQDGYGNDADVSTNGNDDNTTQAAEKHIHKDSIMESNARDTSSFEQTNTAPSSPPECQGDSSNKSEKALEKDGAMKLDEEQTCDATHEKINNADQLQQERSSLPNKTIADATMKLFSNEMPEAVSVSGLIDDLEKMLDNDEVPITFETCTGMQQVTKSGIQENNCDNLPLEIDISKKKSVYSNINTQINSSTVDEEDKVDHNNKENHEESDNEADNSAKDSRETFPEGSGSESEEEEEESDNEIETVVALISGENDEDHSSKSIHDLANNESIDEINSQLATTYYNSEELTDGMISSGTSLGSEPKSVLAVLTLDNLNEGNQNSQHNTIGNENQNTMTNSREHEMPAKVNQSAASLQCQMASGTNLNSDPKSILRSRITIFGPSRVLSKVHFDDVEQQETSKTTRSFSCEQRHSSPTTAIRNSCYKTAMNNQLSKSLQQTKILDKNNQKSTEQQKKDKLQNDIEISPEDTEDAKKQEESSKEKKE